ncbi:MAG: serine/threonine protein kinase [Deltaproteobacteria bacterium]|nr:serine/threonine protein kinase [Deltaproteobacteria bacterium]
MSDNDKTQIVGSQTIQNVAKIHGFEIVRLISDKGGMADVYEAFQSSVGRRVAAKMLKSRFISDENIKKRFEEEAKLLGQLNHANIVQVFDFSNEHLTLFMEFIEGKPLDEIISEKEKLPLEESLRIISGILDGLHYAHGHGIVHRDIKPGNVFLTDDGRVKITDFGIARIVGGGEQAHQTQQGSWVGTPSYISPEQITGDDVGPWSDIYSAGVTLYLLATGKLPFVGENIMKTAVMHLNDAPPPPQQVNPLISSELSGIILKAMAKSPKNRFPTALAFKEAIDRLLNPRKDAAYLQEAKAEWERSKEQSTTGKKRCLLNSIKLSQMALTENPDLPDARKILDGSRRDLKKIRTKQYMLTAGMALIVIAIYAFLILQLFKGGGTLDIYTSEAADVYLDGTKIGTAPFVFKDIPTGRHKLAVEQPGFYRSAEKNIVIKKGETLTVNEVIPSGGTVTIVSSLPGATVKIDGKNSGQTPLTIKLIIGSHSIEIGGTTKEVVVQENDQLIVSF